MQGFELELAGGWREVEPRADAPSLLVEDAGQLLHLNGDLSLRHDFGPVGPVECPLAYDPVARKAYRSVCAAGLTRKDFSQLREYDLDLGRSMTLLDLPLNKWVLWLLEWIGAGPDRAGKLFGLIATDRPNDERVVIEHQLFALSPGESLLALRPLCRDAYRPLAFSRRRGQLIFAGAEGIYLVGLNGRRLASFSGAEIHGDGASFAPQGKAQAIVSSRGLYLWDLKLNRSECLVRSGHCPTWSADGRGFWYRKSGADLYFYDLNTRSDQRILSVKHQRQPEFWNTGAVQQSVCGRYVALTLQAKRLKGVSRKRNAAGEVERVYELEHRRVVMDLSARELWLRPGGASQLKWVD